MTNAKRVMKPAPKGGKGAKTASNPQKKPAKAAPKKDVAKKVDNVDKKRKREDEEAQNVESGEPPKKMTKREKKDAINQKKQQRNSNWDLITNAKLKWEEFNTINNSMKRKKNQDREPKRQKILHELATLLNGKLYEVAIRHDTSRIIQSILKWGNEQQLYKIFEELKPKLKELSENIYGHKVRSQTG
jgi:pumilio family protein 6